MSRRDLVIILLVALGTAATTTPAFGQATATEPKVEEGDIEGAPYRIQIPDPWNGGLVMYAHGYRPAGAEWRPLPDALGAVFLQRGFALAESGYSRQGWAVEEARRDTEALRLLFVQRHGEPRRTFAAGHSLGGIVALALIETHPDAYAGALTVSAPLVSAIQFFSEQVLDTLVTFEALFGDALPEECRPVAEAPQLSAATAEAALQAAPALGEAFALRWGVRRRELAAHLAFYHLIYREVVERAGGHPVDNRNTVYSGFGDDRALNAAVRRYAATPEALAYLRRCYSPTGLLRDPLLAIHTTYDPGVPARLANLYSVTTALAGREQWFVHLRVEADGHCNVGPPLLGRAFDQLAAWAEDGTRPEPGLLR